MPDREKVIKGLEICRHRAISQENCKECPYIYDGRAEQSNCEGVLHWDALAVIKEQDETINVLTDTIRQLSRHIKDLSEYMTPYGKVDDVKAYEELLKEQKNASQRNPVIVCPHCGKRVK